YSLGNFIFQNSTVEKLPHDFYIKYGMDFNDNVSDALDKRSDNGKKGLDVNSKVWYSIIPFWKMQNGKLTQLNLYPIELGYELPRFKRGWPVLSKNKQILENIKQLSEPFGTDIRIENNVGVIC